MKYQLVVVQVSGVACGGTVLRCRLVVLVKVTSGILVHFDDFVNYSVYHLPLN